MSDSMNANDYAQLGVTVAVGALVVGAGYLFYKSDLGKSLLSVAGGVFDSAGSTAKIADYVITSTKGGVEWAWNGWNAVSGLGMSQLGDASNGNFSQMYGSRVEATSAYIVIRARDFDSKWTMKETAYKGAVGMHKDNKAILEKYVLTGSALKPAFQQLVKTADFVVIYPDGSFKSA